MGTAELGEKVGLEIARNRRRRGFDIEVEVASAAFGLKMGVERASGLLV